MRFFRFPGQTSDSFEQRRRTSGRPKHWCRLIHIDPRTLEIYVTRFGRAKAGTVQDGEWDLSRLVLRQHPKIVACLAHWVDGIPWRETGIIDEIASRAASLPGGFDGCRTEAEIVTRYEELDRIFEQVQREGRLRTSYELGRSASPQRERHGVMVHFGRTGNPIFGASGFHRLGMALSLDFDTIPACLGVRHRDTPEDILNPAR